MIHNITRLKINFEYYILGKEQENILNYSICIINNRYCLKYFRKQWTGIVRQFIEL